MDVQQDNFVYHTPEIWESKDTKELCVALLNFHKEFKSVKRDGSAPVGSGGKVRHFATLDGIMETIRPILAKNNLFVEQPITGELIVTFIRHTSGQFRAFAMPMLQWKGQMTNEIQNLGGAITYMRRYAIGAALSLATEEDDDAASSKGIESKSRPSTPAPAPAPAKPAALPEEVKEAWQNKLRGLNTGEEFDKCLKEIDANVGDTPKHPWRIAVKLMLQEEVAAKGLFFDPVDKRFIPKPAEGATTVQ